jgi:integrase/recombinase XerD
LLSEFLCGCASGRKIKSSDAHKTFFKEKGEKSCMPRGKQIIKIRELTASECFEKFLKNCEVKNLSAQTIKTYTVECTCFLRWFGADRSIRDINLDVVDDYIVFIKKKDISQTYVATKIRQIRAFLYFCMEREYMESFKIIIPKADEAIKEPYTAKELEKLIKKPDSRNWVEWRSWAMIQYLIATGNRISTVVNIKISDLDFDLNMITLRKVKNRKAQLIPMSSALKTSIQLYLSLWNCEKDDYLFPEYEGGQLSARGAYDAIKRYNIKRGVTKTSVHLFRHTFAKNYLLAGGDSVCLQRLLGHSTLTMTNHYLRLYATDLQLNYDKFNPLDNIVQKC